MANLPVGTLKGESASLRQFRRGYLLGVFGMEN
jgi:hypothetical protein